MTTKERIAKYGEVFTPEWLVRDVCDLIPDEIACISSKVLDPACGNGNFLVEILRRKLETCHSEYIKGKSEYIKGGKLSESVCIALSSIYGIDILQDNIETAKTRMFDIVRKFLLEPRYRVLTHHWYDVQKRIKVILSYNLIWGDTLKMIQFKNDTVSPLSFQDWTIHNHDGSIGLTSKRSFLHDMIDTGDQKQPKKRRRIEQS